MRGCRTPVLVPVNPAQLGSCGVHRLGVRHSLTPALCIYYFVDHVFLTHRVPSKGCCGIKRFRGAPPLLTLTINTNAVSKTVCLLTDTKPISGGKRDRGLVVPMFIFSLRRRLSETSEKCSLIRQRHSPWLQICIESEVCRFSHFHVCEVSLLLKQQYKTGTTRCSLALC